MRLLSLVAVLAVGVACKEDSASEPRPLDPTGDRSYVLFEAGPVRPVALSPDRSRLFVTNIPDDRLEIFAIAADGALTWTGSVRVGLRPVAVAARSDDEVWVVNHLSDSVSVVDVASSPPRVVRTLLVGDEPRDIVFAGEDRAFVATARRGQHRLDPSLEGVPGAGDPLHTTPGIGRGDVWVFDAADPAPGGELGGRPLAIVSVFSDKLRGLTASPDGATVYAAAFHSGNRTTTVHDSFMCRREGVEDPVNTPCVTDDGAVAPGSMLPPFEDAYGEPAPDVGVVVQQQEDGSWRDEIDRDWSDLVRFDLPDQDLFAIDTASLTVTGAFAGVGTTLFNAVASPTRGHVYVSNTESFNTTRFEGSGEHGGSTVQGHLAETRITIVDPESGAVLPRHLNSHIDYAHLPAPPGTDRHSLSTPLDLAVSGDGGTLYVAAYGSARIGVVDLDALESGSFDPRAASARYVALSGGGPGGLALHEDAARMYVYTRFDNAVSEVDLASLQEVYVHPLHSPEPADIVEGRPLLYDAGRTSSNGEASCASCHMFGDTDHLAWDLGDPDLAPTRNAFNTPFLEPLIELSRALGPGGPGGPDTYAEIQRQNGNGDLRRFHAMKGPLATQTLRGLVNHGAQHWRGDRMVGFFGADTATEPPFDARLSFDNFIVAFEGLLGRPATVETPWGMAAIHPDEMEAFTDFAMALTSPPNPVRRLDGSLREAERRGQLFFTGCAGPASDGSGQPAACEDDEDGVPRVVRGPGHRSDGVAVLPTEDFDSGQTCEGCHALDPARGFFGTQGRTAFEFLEQTAKVPHLRNLYDRVGMFGVPASAKVIPGDNEHMGPQIRGVGYAKHGGVDTIERFLRARVFDQGGLLGEGDVGFFGGEAQRRDVEAYMLAFDSDLPPAAGQQITIGPGAGADAWSRLALLLELSARPFRSRILGDGVMTCDLVFDGVLHGEPRAGLYRPAARAWQLDDGGLVDHRVVLSWTGQGPFTFTCATPGSGVRVALDRDGDGVPDRRDAAPRDPARR